LCGAMRHAVSLVGVCGISGSNDDRVSGFCIHCGWSMCVTTRSFDASDIKIICCPRCRSKRRATSGWVRSHATFQCPDCGNEFNLHDTTIRKTFDVIRRKLSEIARW
jgi:hypothetical protein